MSNQKTTTDRDIVVESLGKQYVTKTKQISAIGDISFVVNRGDFVCIVGPSGCGKTTLLRIIQGLLSQSKGTVWIDPARRLAGMAYIQQIPSLLPWRTVLQNAAVGLEIKRNCSQGTIQYVRDLLDTFRLSEFEDSLPEELSGGMCQRVAIIRALQAKPAILFCDEPFSAIDFQGRLELSTIFKKLCKQSGITVLFVTHNIEEAIFLSDEIVVLSDRPSCVSARFTPNLETGAEHAVECRNSPSFNVLFQQIWECLKGAHA